MAIGQEYFSGSTRDAEPTETQEQSFTAEMTNDLSVLEDVTSNALEALQMMHERLFGAQPVALAGGSAVATPTASNSFAETYRRRMRTVRTNVNRIDHLSRRLNLEV